MIAPKAEQQLDGAMTVDVEDYFHVSAFADVIKPTDWSSMECRVEANTRQVLEIAAETGTRGTFFVLGWVAKRFPSLIQEIQDAGHEIGCHSMNHELVYELGPQKFRDDLIAAKSLLEEITGQPVRHYRAPSFSVTLKSLWALKILVEEGLSVDSSIYPIRHDRYGIPTAAIAPNRVNTGSGPIIEFPGTVCRMFGKNLPVGGGGYLRLMPWPVTRWLLRRVCAAGRPINLYVHPWEFDVDQPRVKTLRWRSGFRHYQNLRTTARKFRAMLSEFRLGTMTEVLQQRRLLSESQEPADHCDRSLRALGPSAEQRFAMAPEDETSKSRSHSSN